jgi:hypothetical protein
MPVRYARTPDEALLFMGLRPCECGAASFDLETTLLTVDGGPGVRYEGLCDGCRRHREFEFRLPDDAPDAGEEVRYGPAGVPSELLDAGEWLVYSDLVAGAARATLEADQRYSDDELIQVHELLSAAAAAVEEAGKFLRPGADRLPDSALWTESGRLLRELLPERFERESLTAELVARRRELAGYEERLAAGWRGAAR